MSKLMSVLGIVLLAIGLALTLVGLINPAQMQVYRLTLETAAILLTGGVLAIGLGGVIGALGLGVPVAAAPLVVAEAVEEKIEVVTRPSVRPEPDVVETAAPEAPPVEEPAAKVRFNPFARKTTAAVGGIAAATVATAATAVDAVADTGAAAVAKGKGAVDDTIAALEQAKADISNAIGGMAATVENKVEDAAEVVEDEVLTDEEVDSDELYVVEEREIRGRPARILSDDTVEAETDEGWMRFENLEHLNEYLDAMGEPA